MIIKKNCLYVTLIALLSMCLTTSCSKDDDEKSEDTSTLIKNKALIAAIEKTAKVTFTKNADGYVDPIANKAMIEGITKLNVSQSELTSMEGIEYFTKLTKLQCYGNQLTSLDVTKNTALTDLYCSGNALTSLDVSKNTALTSFDCNENALTSLDVTKNTALTSFDCSRNALTSLDVTKNTALTELYCHHNAITSLDITKNMALDRLEVFTNQLTSLDVTKHTALRHLLCSENQLTSLDVTKNILLNTLICHANQLSSLDITTLNDINWNGFFCGTQTKGGTTAQDLTLKLTADQNRFIDQWQNESFNEDVVLDVQQ